MIFIQSFSSKKSWEIRQYLSNTKNLIGANFSSADIRGIDFTDKILINTNFTNAKAGQSQKTIIFLIAISFILVIMLGTLLGQFCAAIILFTSDKDQFKVIIISSLILILSLGFIVSSIKRGLRNLLGIFLFLIIPLLLISFISLFSESGKILGLLWAIFFSLCFTFLSAIGEILVLTILQLIVRKFTGFIAVIANSLGFSIAISVLISQAEDPSKIWTNSVYFFVVLLFFVMCGFSYFISWKALKKDENHVWIYNFAIKIATWKATSFRDSDLTDADFTNAHLKCTDFRNATLTRTCWLNAHQLDMARVDQTYLENHTIRTLVVNQYAEKATFDRIIGDLNLENATLKEVSFIGADLSKANLKGITCIDVNFDKANLHQANLENAKLQDASFIEADISEANLQNADLSGAKLVRTQLYEADLTGADLTGAFIQDWGISDKTKLDQVKCREIFMQLPTKENKYDSCRKPDETDEYFQEGDFVEFITPLCDMLKEYHQKYFDPRQQVRILDLPHRGGIDSLASAIALKQLTDSYPQAGIEVMALQGGKDKIIRLQIKVKKEVNRSQISAEYKEKYHKIVSWSNQERQSVLATLTKEANEYIQCLGNIIEMVTSSKQIYLETDINFLGKKRILFLAANPQHYQDEHRLQEEIREIQKGLERAKRREQFAISPKWAVSLDDLQNYLLNEKPQIVHFSGYGDTEKGLVFENKDGQKQFANPSTLAKLFELFKDKLECVFLNACYSEPQAKAISQYIDYVIAINQKISDPAAIKFAVGFYGALGAGRTIEDAFKLGCIAIELENLPESSKPILITKDGYFSGSDE